MISRTPPRRGVHLQVDLRSRHPSLTRCLTAGSAALGVALFATSVITAQSAVGRDPRSGPGVRDPQSGPVGRDPQSGPGVKDPRSGSRGSYTAPRTPWGDPDLQGSYTNSNESGIPMARPAEFAGRRPDQVTPEEMARLMKQRAARIEESAEIIGATTENNTGAGPTHWYENFNPKNSRPWMIADAPDYQVPALTQEARDRAAKVRAARRGGDGYNRGPFDGPEDFTLYVRCITRGVPGSMTPAIYGNSYDITQGPGVVTIRYEMVHEARVIPLDGRPHTSATIKSYMGDARGHFEGDTLVVETTNYLEKAATNGASEHLRTIERFKPSGPNTIEWSITLDDPHTWTRPWTYGMQLTKDPGSQLYEYACHEGNEGMRGMLKAERMKEKEGAK